MRRRIVAGNWKMNGTAESAHDLISKLAKTTKGHSCEVYLCVPFILIPKALEAAKATDFMIAAQNLNQNDAGAFTGEVSAPMLKDFGVNAVIVGHCERRQYFGETDEAVGEKVKAALRQGITPIVCVGETLDQREKAVTFETVAIQLKSALLGLTEDEAKKIILAYEPVWAIGTGKTASPSEANEVCGFLRHVFNCLYKEAAEGISILYGGSVNAANAKELFSETEIDGGLVGGASLKADDFAAIIEAAKA